MRLVCGPRAGFVRPARPGARSVRRRPLINTGIDTGTGSAALRGRGRDMGRPPENDTEGWEGILRELGNLDGSMGIQ